MGPSDLLSVCHAQDVIHRDLKPQNVMIDEKARVKLRGDAFPELRDEIRALRERLEARCDDAPNQPRGDHS